MHTDIHQFSHIDVFWFHLNETIDDFAFRFFFEPGLVTYSTLIDGSKFSESRRVFQYFPFRSGRLLPRSNFTLLDNGLVHSSTNQHGVYIHVYVSHVET